MFDHNTVLRMIFGFKLRYLRLEHKKSYAEVSAATGLSTSYLNDIEKGKKYPKPDKAALLAKCFGISYDQMVSTQSDKQIQPVIDFISSDFFKVFPAEEFGISMEKVLDVFANAPAKTNAFISTVLKLIRSYQIGQDDFYRVALRSYQDVHNNYFPAIEQEAQCFIEVQDISQAGLEAYLKEEGISIDYTALGKQPMLAKLRGYYNPEKQVLYLNSQLDEGQLRFQLLKEVGFRRLGLTDRPYETRLNRDVSFEKLLANFKASYFAIACLVPEDQITTELQRIAQSLEWKPERFTRLLGQFEVTPEMLMQRLTNILPKAFAINDLFFIKLKGTEKGQFQMTKELHLSRIHNPYNNRLDEHLCERWVSVTAIKENGGGVLADGQISEYLDHENKYFCITLSQADNFGEAQPSSVTIGMLITPELRANFNFLKDAKLRKRLVHTTCERCSITDCESRAAAASVVAAQELEDDISRELSSL